MQENTGSVYVPLSMAVTNLSREYLKFRKTITNESSENNYKDHFKEHITLFLDSVDDLLARGASSFLTTELENALLSFRSFIEESFAASEPSSRVIVTYGIRLFGTSQEGSKAMKLSGKKAEFWQGKFGFSQFGISMKFKGDQILAAPLESDMFEEKFMQDTNLLNLLIKEVTLGSHARNVNA